MIPTQELTPVEQFGSWCAKREDKACFVDHTRPSGSKVRQFAEMIAASPAGTPMVVGCSAFAAMQIYLAAAAEEAHVPAYVFVPARKERTAATTWAITHGAIVEEVRPGYPSVYRARARDKAKALGGCIRWNTKQAVIDAQYQTMNVPLKTRRVVIPTASGLTAAGVLLGLLGRDIALHCVHVSPLTNADEIRATAKRFSEDQSPLIDAHTIISTYLELDYSRSMHATLPNGEPLDAFYAAKALHFVGDNDCFWISGLRPVEINL